jgi:hypothetical protein
MQRFVVVRRPGHELDKDGDTALKYLQLAGISAHLGRPEPGHNLIWVEETTDSERAGALLRGHGFEVSESDKLDKTSS